MKKDVKIYVAGHNGLVGSALAQKLKQEGYQNITVQSRAELDLTNQTAVSDFFSKEKPEYVFLAAAKVGGILANSIYPADFIHQNLAIQTNVIHQAYLHKVKRLLFLGSSCIYPRDCPQPIKEEYLLTGPLEKTNDSYAIAKIAGIKMCEAYNKQYGTQFLAVMPTNLYGPNDNFDLETSHVIPALIRKFHEAKISGAPTITLWGTGMPRREFIHVDDLADACLFLMNLREDVFSLLLTPNSSHLTSGFSPPLLNIGHGEDLTIKELAGIIAEIIGYTGAIEWDSSKPDGTPRKLLDISRLTELGWKSKISFQYGIKNTYAWFAEQK